MINAFEETNKRKFIYYKSNRITKSESLLGCFQFFILYNWRDISSGEQYHDLILRVVELKYWLIIYPLWQVPYTKITDHL